MYVETTTPLAGDREKGLYRGTQVAWYILGVIEVFLLLRFVLKMLAANTAAGFTDLVYGVSGFLVAPFRLVFAPAVPVTGSVFEWSTLLAMFIYWLIALGLIRLFGMSRRISGVEARDGLDKESGE